MSTHEHHDPLTCADLSLDQAKLDEARTGALEQILRLMAHYFGCVQIRAALSEGFEDDLRASMHTFAQRTADVISAAYVTKALARTREATANMFEALAAGARVAHQAVRTGESTGDVARAFAAIAACEGRPEILALDNAERSAPAPE